MTNKSTRRALLASLLALVVSISMLIGTTFAWFTDSVTSGRNLIQSGNLDVELEYFDGTDWVPVDENTSTFGYDNWEPGFTKVVSFRITNKGSLALKYQLTADVYAETAGVNKDGDSFLLSDYLYTAVVAADADRDTVLATKGVNLKDSYKMSAKSLEKGASEIVALAIWMPTEVDNVANHDGVNKPSIEFGINLVATQEMSESDSFGKDYDKDAPLLVWDGSADTSWYNADAASYELSSPEKLAGLAKLVNDGNSFSGKTIKLAADMDLNNIAWTAIGDGTANFNGKFYGNGFTIYNLSVSGTKGVGLFGFAGNAAHIEGVHIVGANVSGENSVGTVLGYGYLAKDCLKNCVVENAIVYAAAGAAKEDGDKVGAVAGWTSNGNIIGNKAINCKVYGCRDMGGIVGYVNGENRPVEVSGNTVENVTLSVIKIDDYNKDLGLNINDIVGRIGTDYEVTVKNNYGVAIKESDVSVANTADALVGALENGEDIILLNNVKIDPAGMSNAYGTTGINVKNGQTIDGNGNTLDIKGAGGTWDSGINTTGGIIKNLTVTGSFRGIFINHNSSHSEPVVLDNVTIEGTTYTISCDQGMNQTLTATNSTFKGWTSYAATLGDTTFIDCYFGEGNGYAYCRPYAPTTFVGCEFEAGFEMDARAAVTFENCTIGGVALTADNLSTLVTSNIANASVK